LNLALTIDDDNDQHAEDICLKKPTNMMDSLKSLREKRIWFKALGHWMKVIMVSKKVTLPPSKGDG